jgi:ankyrin repeat protein
LKEAAYLHVLNKLDPVSDPAIALEMVKLLLEHGARLNPAGDRTVTPAQSLILRGQSELRRLISVGNQDPYLAALDGDVTLLARLSAQDERWLKPIPKGIAAVRPADMSGLPEDLMFRAAARGHTDVVLFLLTNGVYAGPIKPLGHTPYFAAYTNARVETAAALRAKLNDTDIFSAIWSLDDAWLEQLIARRPELVNQATDFGMSPKHFGMLPVHAAAMVGNTNALERLVAAGADLNATVESSLPIDPTVRDIAFCAPIHLAIDHSHEETVRWLVEHRAQINRHFSYVESPLGRAGARGHVLITRHLLDQGARLNKPFLIGRVFRTPLDCANDLPDSATKTALIDILREHGGSTVDELLKEGKLKLPGQ